MKRALYILLLITVAITTLCLVTSCFTKAGDDDDDDDDDNDDGGEGSAPEVLETTPDDGDIEVSLGVVIRIKFSTRMDKSSVEEAISSDPVLEGDFEWSGNGEELIFIPSDPLDENSQYDVFISDKALDHEGNELGEPYVFGFQTVDLWSRKFGGQSGGDDEGHGIAVDSTGNVYVTGAETMAPDDKNVWVRKYNKKGDEIWTDTEMGTAGVDDYGHGVAYGGDGEIYVAGYIVNLGEGQEVWLRKYNSQGGIDWTETHNGSANGEDIGTDVAVDEEGNAYVTGWESVVAAGSNVWVRKYNSSGGKEWTETHNGVAILDDGGMGIALGPEGMVHVAGYETSLRDGQDIWVRQYTPEGSATWTDTLNGPADRDDMGTDIAVDAEGNVYVVGYLSKTNIDTDIWVRKYTPKGDEVWTKTYDIEKEDKFYGEDVCWGVAVGPDDSIYMTGWLNSFAKGWVARADSEGELLWSVTHSQSVGLDIAVDQYGSAYVTGVTGGGGEDTDIIVRKYDADGHFSED